MGVTVDCEAAKTACQTTKVEERGASQVIEECGKWSGEEGDEPRSHVWGFAKPSLNRDGKWLLA